MSDLVQELDMQEEVDPSEISLELERYPRTRDSFTLDEICWIMHKIMSKTPLEVIADFTKRSPLLIRFKFLEYRPLNKDGTYNMSHSVKTAAEAKNFSPRTTKEIARLNEGGKD